MATIPQTIHDKPIYFFSKQYFLVYVMGDTLADGPQGIFGRQVFTKMSAVELKREARKHRESGSKYPWIGGDVEDITTLTLSRGLSYLSAATEFGITLPVTAEADAQDQLYRFYKNPVDASKNRYTLICEVFDDTEEYDADGTGVAREPKLWYKFLKVFPIRYKGFEGDASSSDTVEEELELEVSGVQMSKDGTTWM